MRVCGQGPERLSGGPSYPLDFDHKHSSGRILGLCSTTNFGSQGPIASINILKESQGYGDRSGPIILEIDPVILKLS